MKSSNESASESLRLRQAFDSIPDAIHLVDSGLLLQDFNQSLLAWCRRLGHGDPHRGQHVREAFPFLTPRAFETYDSVLNSGQPVSVEETLVGVNVDVRTEIRRVPVVEGGKVVGVATFSRDITERKRMEEALLESETKYRELLELANSIILRWDPEGKITYLNEFGLEFFGFTAEELLGKNVRGTIVPERESTSGRELDKLMDQISHRPQSFHYNENENMTKDGRRVWIAWHNRPILDEQGQLKETLSIGSDLSHHRETELALSESEQRYRYLFEESPAGSILISPDGFIKDVNKTFQKTLGFEREELLGRKVLDFVVPKDVPKVVQRLKQRFLGTKMSETDMDVWAKDGSVHTIVFAGDQAIIHEKGRMAGILLTGMDVTQRRKAEALARQRELELIQADKMASLGVLVSGMAHEINNPNNLILLNANNLRDIWKDVLPLLDGLLENKGDFNLGGLPYSEVRVEVDKMLKGNEEGADRIRRIVESLKDFARKDPGGLDGVVDLNKVVENALVICGNLCKKSTHHFITELQPGLALFRGNFQQIEQVAINLVSNACQALTSQDQSVTVRTSSKGDGEVVLQVEDKGMGIPEADLNHVMDPFFTTKRDTGGTGLGLSISYRLVKDHGGDLVLESQPGRGTLVTVTLPSITEAPRA
jgi:PAS domain S-box-containing protein